MSGEFASGSPAISTKVVFTEPAVLVQRYLTGEVSNECV